MKRLLLLLVCICSMPSAQADWWVVATGNGGVDFRTWAEVNARPNGCAAWKKYCEDNYCIGSPPYEYTPEHYQGSFGPDNENTHERIALDYCQVTRGGGTQNAGSQYTGYRHQCVNDYVEKPGPDGHLMCQKNDCTTKTGQSAGGIMSRSLPGGPDDNDSYCDGGCEVKSVGESSMIISRLCYDSNGNVRSQCNTSSHHYEYSGAGCPTPPKAPPTPDPDSSDGPNGNDGKPTKCVKTYGNGAPKTICTTGNGDDDKKGCVVVNGQKVCTAGTKGCIKLANSDGYACPSTAPSTKKPPEETRQATSCTSTSCTEHHDATKPPADNSDTKNPDGTSVSSTSGGTSGGSTGGGTTGGGSTGTGTGTGTGTTGTGTGSGGTTGTGSGSGGTTGTGGGSGGTPTPSTGGNMPTPSSAGTCKAGEQCGDGSSEASPEGGGMPSISDAPSFGTSSDRLMAALQGSDLVTSGKGLANSMPAGGSCPLFSIPYYGRTISNNAMCDLLAQYGPGLGALLVAMSAIGAAFLFFKA